MKSLGRVLGAVVVFLILVFVVGWVAEAIGNWTDAHPDQRTLVWTLWNGTLIVVAIVGVVVLWRRYRRPGQPSA